MRTFRNRALTPPSGFRYTVPGTLALIEAGDLEALVRKVAAHLDANKVERPANLAAVIEHDICLRNPADMSRGDYGPGDQQVEVVTTGEIRNNLQKTMRLKWGRDTFLAPEAEAEARAEICAGCQYNVVGEVCTTCNGLKEHVIKAIGDRHTALDDQLGICKICKCVIKVKVQISKAALLVETKEAGLLKYPENCWMRGIKV